MENLTNAIAEVGSRIATELKELEAMDTWNPVTLATMLSERGFAEAVAVPLTGTEKQVEHARSIITTYINQARAVIAEAAVRVQNNEMPSRWIFNLKDAIVYELWRSIVESFRIHSILTEGVESKGLPASDVISAQGISSLSIAIAKAEKVYRDNK